MTRFAMSNGSFAAFNRDGDLTDMLPGLTLVQLAPYFEAQEFEMDLEEMYRRDCELADEMDRQLAEAFEQGRVYYVGADASAWDKTRYANYLRGEGKGEAEVAAEMRALWPNWGLELAEVEMFAALGCEMEA